ncbi:carboxypeptidase regulatory-like domain-containing protein [Silvibacterium acidisoli]|uniref:carboxypeptidase regulatory-like domain-containing protein n=1 Tax=Acidobacteriaceae bacterium ZG23-2 TaxID=2883246 RepID=UPI00406C7848
MFKARHSFVAALFLFAAAAFGQQGSSGTITGTVLDPSDAAIPGAQITATETQTNVSSSTRSTNDGLYNFPTLPPGTYRLTATHQGFTSAAVVGIQLRTAQVLTSNLTMQLGGATETVTVSSDSAQLLDTSTAQISHYVTAKEIESWPIPVTADGERQLQDFIFKNLPGTTGETYLGSINGGQYFSNEIYLDGVSMGTTDTAELGPSVDAVDGFNLQTGVMGAQYDGGSTAVSNFSIHSGTNRLHGTLYEYFQNEDLNANSYDNNAFGIDRPTQRLNNFGGTVGGPVWIPKIYNGKDKTFFFVSYEKTIKRNFMINGTTTMPTQPMLNGDFSGFLNPALTNNAASGQPSGAVDNLGRSVTYGQIYDPATTRNVVAGQPDPVTGLIAVNTGIVREPFVNNQIPTARFDPVAKAYLALPFPTNFVNNHVVNNIASYTANQPVFNQDDFSIKLDQVITQAHKVSFYMTTVTRTRSQQQGSTWSLPNTNPLDTWNIQSTPGKLFRVNEYWTISPNMVNRFGAGYNRFTNSYVTAFYNQDWASQLGLQNLPSIGFPAITFGGAAALGGSNDRLGAGNIGGGTIDQSTMFIDQLSWTHRAHQFQFGTEWRFYNENDDNPSTQATFGFSNVNTAGGLPTDTYSGNAFASFLLGQVNNTSRTLYNGSFGYRRREVGSFVQDNWKLNEKLSLSLGLRWNVLTGLTETQGQMTTFAPNLINAAAGLPGSIEFASQLHKKGFENTNWALILPRFGFAYQAMPKIVFRGGFGVNSQSPEASPFISGSPSSLGYSAALAVSQTTNPQVDRDISAFLLSQPYPASTVPLPNYDSTVANLGGAQAGSVPAYVNPNGARTQYAENYNFGFQYDMGHQTVAELNYVGNTIKRIYSAGTDQMNQLPIGYLARYGDALLDPLSAHPEIALPYGGFDTSNLVQQALAPYPQYAGGGISQIDSNRGWSRYDSMQATLTRHAAKGLSVMAAYTWAKAMTNANTNCNSGVCGYVQDVHNLKLEKSVATGISVPQQFKLTVIYDLPVGRGQLLNLHGPLDWAIGGWTLSGNLLYQSGNVLAITDSGVNNGIFAATRPNFTGKAVKLNSPGHFDVVSGTGPEYLNPGGFAHVTTSCDGVAPGTPCNNVALTTGNVTATLGNVYGPALKDENFSLQKVVTFREGTSLQIRADAVNAFNRAGRGNPVTDINNGLFGQITGPGTDSQGQDGDSYFYQPRVVQLAMRLRF